MTDSPLLSRRALIAGVASLLATRCPAEAGEPFTWADVRHRAELLARQPFAGYGSPAPRVGTKLGLRGVSGVRVRSAARGLALGEPSVRDRLLRPRCVVQRPRHDPRGRARPHPLAAIRFVAVSGVATADAGRSGRARIRGITGPLPPHGRPALWRPLDNAPRLRVSRFHDPGMPGGFGLLQRDRVFDHYQDLEALYHRRPSAWIQPRAPWPAGAVELLEFPSRHEHNVAAFWVCDAPLVAGTSLKWASELRFGGPGADPSPQARVAHSRTGAGRRPGTRRFVIDFEGDALRGRARELVREDVTPATPTPPVVEATPGGLRVAFERPRPATPTEVRCVLRAGDSALSETWSYEWPPR
jgi:glucan biosynthesis protein